MALLEQEPHTAVGEDALLHGEALLVVAAGDPHHVTLELVSEGVGLDLLTHPLLVEGPHLRNTNLQIRPAVSSRSIFFHLQLISNLEELLASRGWE